MKSKRHGIRASTLMLEERHPAPLAEDGVGRHDVMLGGFAGNQVDI